MKAVVFVILVNAIAKTEPFQTILVNHAPNVLNTRFATRTQTLVFNVLTVSIATPITIIPHFVIHPHIRHD